MRPSGGGQSLEHPYLVSLNFNLSSEQPPRKHQSHWEFRESEAESVGRCGFSSVQSLSRVQLFTTPWTAACQASLSITNSWSLLKLVYVESVMPCNHLILCRPLLLPPSIFPASGSFQMSQFFASDGQSIRVSASASVLPMNEYSGLISFRMDWLDLLAIQGNLKHLQHHSSKAWGMGNTCTPMADSCECMAKNTTIL